MERKPVATSAGGGQSRRSGAESTPVEFLCTICCAEKRPDEEALPARERYLSPRIAQIVAESEESNRPLLILSGRFGLIGAQEQIPCYDEPLEAEKVSVIEPLVVRQLREHKAKRLLFVARPRTTPGWGPYFDLIEGACKTAGVSLSHVAYHQTGEPMVS